MPSDERRELGAALRRLLDVVVQTAAEPAGLREAATVVDELTARLAGPVSKVDMSVAAGSYLEQMSLVGGRSHPIAPQLTMTPAATAPRVWLSSARCSRVALGWSMAASWRCSSTTPWAAWPPRRSGPR